MATKKRASENRTKAQFPGASETPDPETPVSSKEEGETIQRDHQDAWERRREQRRQDIHEQLRELRQNVERVDRRR